MKTHSYSIRVWLVGICGWLICVCGLNLNFAQAIESPDPIDPAADAAFVERFLSDYCIDCHGKVGGEGDREFETFTLPLASVPSLITADEIIDQVTLGDMPPEDAVQPDQQDRLAVIEALRNGIDAARDRFESTGGRTVLRRLAHREYENTLATLLDRRVDTLGLTADFPKETISRHLDNIGSSLVTSGFLLDQYFQSAERLIESRLGHPKVDPQTWHFEDHFVQYEELQGSHRAALNYEYLCIYEQPNTDTRQGGYGHIEDFLEGVPVSGLYDIEVHAQAMHRDTHYDPEIFRIDFSEPFQLAVVPGDVRKGHIHYPQSIEPILGSTLVPDDQPEWLTFRVWLEAGQTPRFIFPNGPYESRASVLAVNKRYEDELGKQSSGVSRTTLLRKGALPHIRIGEVKVHGPVDEPGGSREEIAVFGDGGFDADKALDQLYVFARRAYRRPLETEDRERISTIYQKRIDEGADQRQAALDTVKFVLCSPSFLYLRELTPSDDDRLAPHDLAARLSYAIWASPPDDQLMKLADDGTLTEDAALDQQVDRMLGDPRSAEFVSAFLDSWLNLREIGSLPPPREDNIDYYAEALPMAMKREAQLFFQNLLEQNGPVTDLLDCDYAYVDKRLAKLYGLPEAETLRLADGFKRVQLDDSSRRGGVLGMAGVLTASANGVDTSPVTRGVWVLENLLGVTPPPPPDEVPSIDADVTGATTIRDRLAKHRVDPACNACHRKIDPMGFALESFDPIGRWRDHYQKSNNKKGPAIDTTGVFPAGQTYNNFADFKRLLVETRSEVFTRHLTETLLAYATGRHMEALDRFAIDDIVREVHSHDDGLRTMITEVLTSDMFLSR